MNYTKEQVDIMIKSACDTQKEIDYNVFKNRLKEKIKQYLYFVGTPEGAEEFSKLDREGKTDASELAGTTRVFKYCFKDFVEVG